MPFKTMTTPEPCVDSTERFPIDSVDWILKPRKCAWVASAITTRCTVEEVKQNCPATCGLCTSTVQTPISSIPTPAPSSVPTLVPTMSSNPSSQPSVDESIFPDLPNIDIPDRVLEIGAYVLVGLLVVFLSCCRSGQQKKDGSSNNRKRGRRARDNTRSYDLPYDEESFDIEGDNRKGRTGRKERRRSNDRPSGRRRKSRE